MRVYRSIEKFRPSEPQLFAARPVVTVGSFDGVHLGHQFLVNELIQWGRGQGAPAVVMTFDTHPRTFMTGEEIKRITTTAQKLALLEGLGVDATLLVPFDERLKATTALDFCGLLRRELNLRGLLLGHNNRMGRDREGTPETLKRYGETHGFEVRTGEPVETGGRPISSSSIRDHIESGDFLWARKMLGRPYAIEGVVQRGKQLGRTIGFPTINLPLEGVVHPPFGVYGVRVELERLGKEKGLVGAANIGVRPTVGQTALPLLEVHILDFSGDCYGQSASVEFAFHVRGEQKFPGLDALKAQLKKDIEVVRERFDAPGV